MKHLTFPTFSKQCPAGRPTDSSNRLTLLSDAILIEHARLGDTEAANELLSRHMKKFRSYARLICQSGPEADNICMEACLKALASLSRLHTAAQFSAWVCGFVRNEARKLARQENKCGTKLVPLDINIMEDMCDEALAKVAGQASPISQRLRRENGRLSPTLRSHAHLMLNYLEEHEELPTVRILAAKAHIGRSTAHRHRLAILASWQRVVSSETRAAA